MSPKILLCILGDIFCYRSVDVTLKFSHNKKELAKASSFTINFQNKIVTSKIIDFIP